MPTETPVLPNIPITEQTEGEELKVDFGFDEYLEVQIAIAGIEAEDRIANSIVLAPESTLDQVGEDLKMDTSGGLADQYPDLIPVFDAIMKTHGLTDYAQITPQFLDSAAESGRKRESARRTRLRIRTVTAEEFKEKVDQASAAIDALADPK